MKKRFMSMLIAVCMVFTLFPSAAFAEEAGIALGTSSITEGAPLCENHKTHDKDCGYIEAKDARPCGHLNEDGGYSCGPVLDSGVSGNIATPGNAEQKYVCDHSDGCGCKEAVDGADCTHECELCKDVAPVLLSATPRTAIAGVPVATYDELTAALADASISTITMTANITAPGTVGIKRNITINGGGHTLSAAVTGTDAWGKLQAGSDYTLLTVSSGKTLTLNNMTIKGGSQTAVNNVGTLRMNKIILTQSGSATATGGGLYNTDTAVLTDCAFTRNVARNGGGFVNKGKMIMDNCSVTENRSLYEGGGGCENNGSTTELYLNNCTFANNQSKEIGGAINNYGGILYALNTTIVGNISDNGAIGAKSGGGIGYNEGTVTLVNSIVSNNYAKTSNTGSFVPSDYGKYAYGDKPTVHHSLMGAYVTGASDETGPVDGSNNATEIAGVFAGERNSILLDDVGTPIAATGLGTRPVLVKQTNNGTYAAPLSETPSHQGVTGGCDVYFTYDASTATVSAIGYGTTPTYLVGTTGTKVVTFQDSSIRSNSATPNVVRGSMKTGSDFHTIRVAPPENCAVSGASAFGDTYAANAQISLTATPDDWYQFVGWYNEENMDAPLSTAATYVHTLTADITIVAKVEEVAPFAVTFDVGGSGTNSTVKVYPGNNVTAPATDPVKDGCHFSGWYLDDTKFDFTKTTITSDITLRAKFDAHTPGADNGDCTTAIKCSVCGVETTPAKTHTISDWQNDATNHWKKCANAGCTHTEQSTVHTFGEWIIDNEATETTAGSKHKVCDTCKYKETVTIPVASHIHTPSSEWSSDATNHWHDCVTNDGTKLDSAAHNFGEWVTDTAATEATAGNKHRDCTVCGYRETSEIAAVPVSVTQFTVGNYHYAVTSTGENNSAATVKVTGFAKGRSASKVTIDKTVTYMNKVYNITAIADKAFYKKTKIKKVSIGDNIVSIGKKAFYGCTKLTDAVIGNKVTALSDNMFYKCTNLTKVTVGTGLKTIGKHVFCRDKKLTSITIKSSKLTKIGQHNLYQCQKLKIKVPSSKAKAYTKLFKNQGQKSSVKITK